MTDKKKQTARDVVREWAVGDVDQALDGLAGGVWAGVVGDGHSSELERLLSMQADWAGGEQW